MNELKSTSVDTILILPDGRILVQNLTRPMAEVLTKVESGGRNQWAGTRQKDFKASYMNFQTEIETLIRARYPILYIISSEEMRVQNAGRGDRQEAAEKSF